MFSSGKKDKEGDIYAKKDPPKEDVSNKSDKDAIAGQFKVLRKRLLASDSGASSRGHLIMSAVANFFAYIIPFLLIVFIGAELGHYFAQWMEPWSSYGLAFTLELGAAMLTVKLGHCLENATSGGHEGNNGAIVILVGVGWILLTGGSALALWMVLTDGGTATGSELISAIIRVGSVAILDFASAVALIVKSANVKREIEHMKGIASNIEMMASAQRSIEEAEKNAALRDQMMQATLKIQDDMSKQIGQAVSMVMSSIMERMEKTLKEDGNKNERGYGRH